MRIVSKHPIPVHGLHDSSLAVNTLANVSCCLVFLGTVPAPLRSLPTPLLVEISQLNVERMFAEIAELEDFLVWVLWLWVFAL